MRGKLAKRIRKFVYGDYSIRSTKYHMEGSHIVADDRRKRYQNIKRNLREWIGVLKEGTLWRKKA
jgi:hypothetical protein